ncbi:hypothetical protein Zmor_017987 [Zophobas morio]|uniref:Uncharacterized protein n=1 Tax=Zophobas morio TaxID=2755281 RepID=A0AA38IA93_9CUCU|nr:hypothetical protein Zmor_017987 [Zophobas morio]
MQILEDPTLLFRKRKGTTNKGSDYENLIIAELILSFINDDKVKDFKVWSNDDNFGLFDDIVIEIEFVNGKIDKYAMQVKYSNDARILTKNSLTEQKGNFSIEKYHADFKKSKISDYKILLYTNRKFDISEGLEIDRNIKTSNFNLIIQQVENSTLNSGRCFKLASEPPDAFFDNFFLLTNQTDVDGIRKNIEDYFHQKFNCHDYSFKKFIDFVTEWSNLEGKMVKLCKRLVQTKITLILLSELYHPLIINGSNITPHMNLLRNIIMNCHTISFVKCTENVLVTLWSDLESESAKPLLTKLSRLYHISIDNNISILLWLMGNCPLIVTQNPVLVKAINLCPDLNFVILDDSEGTKVSNLDARLLADVVTTFRCSLQGKCDISLENVFRRG